MDSGERYYELSLLGRDTFLETVGHAALIRNLASTTSRGVNLNTEDDTGEFAHDTNSGNQNHHNRQMDSWAMKWQPAAKFEVFPLIKIAGSHFVDLITLGRTASNDIRIDNFSVSRSHAFFRQREGAWFICDAGSKNGTRVNRQLLKPRTEYRLTDHSKVLIGAIEMKFCSANALFDLLSEY